MTRNEIRTVARTLNKSSQPACPTMVHRTQTRALLMQMITAPKVHETTRSVPTSFFSSAIMIDHKEAKDRWRGNDRIH